MKKLGQFIIFLISTALRMIPFVIFIVTHIFWDVYTYSLNPLDLLDYKKIPDYIGDFFWLYVALGLIILVFLTLRFGFLAYATFIGAFLGQNVYFLRIWDNKVYHLGLKSALPKWFFLIFAGLFIGFILQTLFTGGKKVGKISKYNRLRKSDK